MKQSLAISDERPNGAFGVNSGLSPFKCDEFDGPEDLTDEDFDDEIKDEDDIEDYEDDEDEYEED